MYVHYSIAGIETSLPPLQLKEEENLSEEDLDIPNPNVIT